jgi:hypothetical protein
VQQKIHILIWVVKISQFYLALKIRLKYNFNIKSCPRNSGNPQIHNMWIASRKVGKYPEELKT